MRETIASVKRELEESRQDHNATKRKILRHKEELNKIGRVLRGGVTPGGPAMLCHSSDERMEFSAHKVAELAACSNERINGLEHHLAREKELTKDLLDRFAPHKSDPRTTAADDGVASLGGR